MPIRVMVAVTIDIYGDGYSTQAVFGLSSMATPAVMVGGVKPTGVGNVKMVGGVGGVVGSLSGGKVTLTFDNPPPVSPSTKLIIEFLYGPAT